MIRKLKKGFTLVELVVVIAVVAILAAVSVVSYLGITKKAKESNDKMVIDQFNNVLTSTLALKKKGDIHQLLENLDENAGFDIRTFTPELQGTSFVYFNKDGHESFAYWDNTKQEVVYPKDLQGTKKSTDLWFFDDVVVNGESVTFDDGASHYFKSLSKATTVYVENGGGLDVGQQSVTEINVINEAAKASGNIVVRTNGGTLKINAPLDTLDHYGDGEVLDIAAIAGESYHEYGNFPKASIGQGRIVVEESGDIPAVEITAVPTSENPVKVETSKDIVVSASPEVVEQLGDNDLENVEVKVTNAQASVVVDEKINKDNVEAAGKSSSEVVSIKKVSTLSELLFALSNKDKYIMFANNIATNGTDLINIKYSVTLDGNGYKLTGNGGLRGSVKQMICFGYEASQLIDKVVVKNLSVETTTVTRPLECRGNTKEIVFDNVILKASGPSNDQGFTFGGNYSSLMKLTLKNCDFAVGSDGYAFIFFNAVDMVVEDSTITGWAGLYFKSPSSSHGARDSKVYISNTDFICHNENWGPTNSFGAIVFEDGNIDVTLVDTNLDVTSESDQEQCAILFSSYWAAYFDTNLKNGHVIIKGESSINGTIDTARKTYDLSNDIKIEGGTFTSDPTEYVASGHSVSRSGSLYIVK